MQELTIQKWEFLDHLGCERNMFLRRKICISQTFTVCTHGAIISRQLSFRNSCSKFEHSSGLFEYEIRLFFSTVFKPEELLQALMPSLEKLYRQNPESLPFQQPVDPTALQIPVSTVIYLSNLNVSFINLQLLVDYELSTSVSQKGHNIWWWWYGSGYVIQNQLWESTTMRNCYHNFMLHFMTCFQKCIETNFSFFCPTFCHFTQDDNVRLYLMMIYFHNFDISSSLPSTE